MLLASLLDSLLIKQVSGDTDKVITGITVDSRKVKPGNLFICLKGFQADGHRFACDAISNGATALIVETEIEDVPSSITLVKVPDTRRAMAVLSDFYYEQPSKQLRLIGVTGTNGKTTTTHLIHNILNCSGRKTGLIGTIHMICGDYCEKTVNTTPEAIDSQRYLHKMVDDGAQYAVLEVSSHALAMGRVRGVDFNTAVFTNLSHDHLDYHQSMTEYARSKEKLFSQLGNAYGSDSKYAVLNVDCETSTFLAEATTAQVIRYGILNEADVRGRYIRLHPEGTDFVVETFKGTFQLHLNIPGMFNVYNALASISACIAENIPLEQIKEGLESFKGVSGRFQPVLAGQDFNVIVDYAHNPDGLENALKTAREFTSGRLLCVIGCEGDRDHLKRPIMARIASRYSDIAIFTSDNTRSEDPELIIKQMVDGVESGLTNRYVTIVDRKDAIRYALEQATKANDCVIIAGKGHETHQIVKNVAISFNDIEVAEELIRHKLVKTR
ncbi:UDP-N-acetylmuramoyl-L-alanyl-D-glutamate--2,6-diaminopimelate ligase [Paenibacillus donghaensis]|uniref:UDP-N-acetylmuramoyl-L-alanyl-D-glutamate--2, 6-diaminopimelate ligase n=1 Tax=Paenibacillus donghaensis TaxID=414771 RepID=UPI0018841531|nr:UDP-N-acetylmuramoyl-L-alanyl-D-glutamate--2,6-diaminopimelate ligase [Paenibacillus donghaensis]MBE9914148.1 UDP-N-acetylmuramoyl-L-alanyl-D-glutamate--2,6-diaminopimelate ligase [Paenibacillus donghaensis]